MLQVCKSKTWVKMPLTTTSKIVFFLVAIPMVMACRPLSLPQMMFRGATVRLSQKQSLFGFCFWDGNGSKPSYPAEHPILSFKQDCNKMVVLNPKRYPMYPERWVFNPNLEKGPPDPAFEVNAWISNKRPGESPRALRTIEFMVFLFLQSFEEGWRCTNIIFPGVPVLVGEDSSLFGLSDSRHLSSDLSPARLSSKSLAPATRNAELIRTQMIYSPSQFGSPNRFFPAKRDDKHL